MRIRYDFQYLTAVHEKQRRLGSLVLSPHFRNVIFVPGARLFRSPYVALRLARVS